MDHVFISYSHKDTKYSHAFANHLHEMGFEVWIDERLDYGSAWPQEIQRQLDSCTAFIVIMSPRSFASEWVQNELSRAKRLKKKIFPVLLEGDGPWLSVESTQTADVRDGNFPDEKFYEDLEEVIPRKASAAPRPSSKKPVTPPSKKNTSLYLGIGVVALLILGGFGYWKFGPQNVVEETPIPTRAMTEPASATPPVTDPTSQPTPTLTETPAPPVEPPTITPIPQLSATYWITYSSFQGQTQNLFEVNPVTKEIKDVIVERSHDRAGAWSPGGDLFAFESTRANGFYQIYLYNRLQETTTQLTDFDKCSNWAPNWASTGSKIVFYSNCENKQRDVYIMNRDGSGRTKLTKNNGENKFPVFSPDNSLIAFTSTRKGKDQVYIMNVDGSDQHFIADGCGSTFSPDGEWVWFSASCDNDGDIKRVRVDGSDLETVGSLFGQNPVVSPDGFFAALESGGNIWVMRVDGTDPVKLTSSGTDGTPSWKR